MRQRKGSAGSTPDVRGTIRKIADGEPYTVPATVDDPLISGGIQEALAEKGFPKHQRKRVPGREDRRTKKLSTIPEFFYRFLKNPNAPGFLPVVGIESCTAFRAGDFYPVWIADNACAVAKRTYFFL